MDKCKCSRKGGRCLCNLTVKLYFKPESSTTNGVSENSPISPTTPKSPDKKDEKKVSCRTKTMINQFERQLSEGEYLLWQLEQSIEMLNNIGCNGPINDKLFANGHQADISKHANGQQSNGHLDGAENKRVNGHHSGLNQHAHGNSSEVNGHQHFDVRPKDNILHQSKNQNESSKYERSPNANGHQFMDYNERTDTKS